MNGKEIHRGFDPFGPLVVIDSPEYRYLSFGLEDEQSCQLKSAPAVLQHEYTQAMCLAFLFNSPKNIIVLGLGGGCLVTAVHHCFSGVKIRAIELRQQVIVLAYKYFQLPRSKRLQVINADANAFLQDCSQKKTDILFADIYTAEGVDARQTEAEFIERCHLRLKTGGVLVLNCWQEHRYDQTLKDVLQRLFGDVRVCSTASGNWIIIATKATIVISNKELKQQAQKLSAQLGINLVPMVGRLQTLAEAPASG
ncbi:Polyamine aminopropyltransferase [Sinobacterium norvegicum]|uniref:Polyamine aminopropyltransferase n=1 Tax=Sinobacterium norvegicum TaxID=1641715 RepID=A0ABN8EIY3_9GAMM|nr:methyltransferase [Sinobacterium norvegicum]CAH0991613.1 Polyamine aminopropyltransferase [Sinobacterium norvegicum]